MSTGEKLTEVVKNMPERSKSCGFWRIRRATTMPSGGTLLAKSIGYVDAGSSDNQQSLVDKLYETYPEEAARGGKFYFIPCDLNRQEKKDEENIIVELPEEETPVDDSAKREEIKAEIRAEQEQQVRVKSLEDKLDRTLERIAAPKEDSRLTDLLVQTFQDSKLARAHELELAKMKMEAEDKKRAQDFEVEKKKIEAEVLKHEADLKREKEKAEEEGKKWEREIKIKEQEMQARLEEVKSQSKREVEHFRELMELKREDPNTAKTLSDALNAIVNIFGTLEGLKEKIGELPGGEGRNTLLNSLEKFLTPLKDVVLKSMELKAQEGGAKPALPLERGRDMLKEIAGRIDVEMLEAFATAIAEDDSPGLWADTFAGLLGPMLAPMLNTPWEKICATILAVPNLSVSENAKTVLRSARAQEFWRAIKTVVREEEKEPEPEGQ